ncbi:hypothetical protein LTR09_008467 [Extremus antarcticus]|uniref:Uncharacterized protein n=1 Tax=Extremus antarcticus TaxID=702011 RepID=A0AAJ0GAD4_9PEZI|nr:hypothetical protein LTR09_008467 [Extremus antarcticus]
MAPNTILQSTPQAACRLAQIAQELRDQIFDEAIIAERTFFQHRCSKLGKYEYSVKSHFTNRPAIDLASRYFHSQLQSRLEDSPQAYAKQEVVGLEIDAMEEVWDIKFPHSEKCRHLIIRLSVSLKNTRWINEKGQIPTYTPSTDFSCLARDCISIIESFSNLLTVEIELHETGGATTTTLQSWTVALFKRAGLPDRQEYAQARVDGNDEFMRHLATAIFGRSMVKFVVGTTSRGKTGMVGTVVDNRMV